MTTLKPPPVNGAHAKAGGTFCERGHPAWRRDNFALHAMHCRICDLIDATPDRYGQSDAYWHGGEQHWAGIDERMDAMAGRDVGGHFEPWPKMSNRKRLNDIRNAWEFDDEGTGVYSAKDRGEYEALRRQAAIIHMDGNELDPGRTLPLVRNILAGEFVQSAGEHDMLPATFNERADRHVGHTRREVDEANARCARDHRAGWGYPFMQIASKYGASTRAFIGEVTPSWWTIHWPEPSDDEKRWYRSACGYVEPKPPSEAVPFDLLLHQKAILDEIATSVVYNYDTLGPIHEPVFAPKPAGSFMGVPLYMSEQMPTGVDVISVSDPTVDTMMKAAYDAHRDEKVGLHVTPQGFYALRDEIRAAEIETGNFSPWSTVTAR